MQLSSYSSNPQSRIKYLKNKLGETKNKAYHLYRIIKEESDNMSSFYAFNQNIDELWLIIKEIIDSIELIAILSHITTQKEPSTITPETKRTYDKDNLIFERDLTSKKIALIDNITSKIKDEPALYRLVNKLDLERMHSTFKLEDLNSILKSYEEKPTLSDGEIDIYLTMINEGPGFKGKIFLYNTPVEIGNIEYRGVTDLQWLGDIGYNIKTPYRGHNYAYKALNLIKEKILSFGITQVTITTHNDNIPSQKTIEKFGGVRVPSDAGSIYRYQCDLTLNLEDQQSMKK